MFPDNAPASYNRQTIVQQYNVDVEIYASDPEMFFSVISTTTTTTTIHEEKYYAIKLNSGIFIHCLNMPDLKFL